MEIIVNFFMVSSLNWYLGPVRVNVGVVFWHLKIGGGELVRALIVRALKE